MDEETNKETELATKFTDLSQHRKGDNKKTAKYFVFKLF